MSPNRNKKKSRRRYKYHAVTFKLTSGQYKSLKNYCKARRTTPVKLIKKSIERFISHYEYEVPAELYLTENQLDLFEEIENEQCEIDNEKLTIENEQLTMNFER
ncbi:MAG: hypothetical protein IIW55_01485 [Bacteroidales bacterium]|nr:hypothetical protein [Bacteroidales bacterium]